MNRNEAYRQFAWMVFVGAISTAIAILFVRHTHHYWMGFATGVPFALLLCLPIYLIDVVLTVFLLVAVNRSISLAIGVIIGFTVDYLFCPLHTDTTTRAEWLVACSLIGGLCGWAVWQVKRRLILKQANYDLAMAS